MMSLTLIDFSVITVYILISLLVGLLYTKTASKNTTEFFLSGRRLPWWLAGTGMVATTFAADTPLAVAGIVARNGIAGNWIWWASVFGGMLTVFFFARLWRRAQILTDLEFIELRYSGEAAKFLRGFKALYLGLLMNAIILGWVNLAMYKIIKIMLPAVNTELVITALAFTTAFYSVLSGLWGVTVTDAVQFVIAMFGCIVLAVLALHHPTVTDSGGLMKILPDWMFQFLPRLSEAAPSPDVSGIFELTAMGFLALVAVQWWASWYPGSEPGGGGYVAQRMMSAKDEKHSLFATLWFIVAHYCVRPWPWIMVGLVSAVLYPHLPPESKEDGFVYLMRDLLPAGLRGLLIAAFLAAYMSTLSTHLNWGTSYILNDFYRRFFKPDETEKHYIFVSRIFTALLTLFSLFITFFVLDTIRGAWEFILQCGAGVGFVLILRWFWWRLNAWSEITAMIAPIFAYIVFSLLLKIPFPNSLFYIVSFTISATLIATFITKPDSREHLINFYRRTRVGGILWYEISKDLPEVQSDKDFFRLFIDWILGCLMVFAFLFAIGKFIFGQVIFGSILLFIGICSAAGIYYDFNRRGWMKFD
ncbi:MAG: sodium:solute symporter family protein [Chloroherpetonaceae bacterium]|nr:sodium:solute symporter family protein [Chloroherpetonaceae bacterium]